MLLNSYLKEWKKINLTPEDIGKITLAIEDKCFTDIDIKYERNDIFIDSIVDVFNDLCWFISGEGECKDMFVSEHVKTLPINDDIVFPITEYDTTIEKRTINLVEILKSELDIVKLKTLISKLNELYRFDEKYIKEKYYLENNYQLGKLKTKQTILRYLKDI